jgi:hypothetical protein
MQWDADKSGLKTYLKQNSSHTKARRSQGEQINFGHRCLPDVPFGGDTDRRQIINNLSQRR